MLLLFVIATWNKFNDYSNIPSGSCICNKYLATFTCIFEFLLNFVNVSNADHASSKVPTSTYFVQRDIFANLITNVRTFPATSYVNRARPTNYCSLTWFQSLRFTVLCSFLFPLFSLSGGIWSHYAIFYSFSFLFFDIHIVIQLSWILYASKEHNYTGDNEYVTL